MSKVDLLAPIRKLLSVRKRWCQEHAAVSSKGLPIDPHSPKAVAWCLMGACDKAYRLDSDTFRLVDRELDRRSRELGASSDVTFNDDGKRKHSEIKELLRDPFYGPAPSANHSTNQE